MTDEQQIAALREEIRRAGAGASLVSFAMFLVGGTVLLVVLALSGVVSGYTWPAFQTVLIALCAAGLCGGSAAVVFRRLRARSIRQRLASLPMGERLVTVSPLLQDENQHTRQIAALLVADLRRAGEITPAAAPAPCGHEASPAENAR